MRKLYAFLMCAVGAFPTFSQNVLISDQNHPCEPTIMMDPKNPHVIVAGTVLDNYYVSADTGKTWAEYKLQSPFGVWGDPVLGVDTSGHFYYFHLSNPPNGNWIDRIVCQKSVDGGHTWSEGTFTGLNGAKAQDKHWCAIDRNKNYIYLTWTQFDEYGSTNPGDSSLILFSKSTDGGQTWTPAQRINKIAGDCLDSDNTVEGAVPSVGPNGEVYVAWAGPKGIVFDRSLDEGATWMQEDILVDPMPTGWDYQVPGIYRSNGLPVTACDLSGGPHRGTIYINWSDQRNGPNDTDVWMAKSTDGGNTWSSPIRINDDPAGKHQFFTWMTVDQTTGYLYFVFYDRREHTDPSTDVYLAWSTDGGATFANKKISESSFVPNLGVFFGDYNNIVAHAGIIRPIWTRMHNGELSIWTDLLSQSEIISSSREPIIGSFEVENFPNPVSDTEYFSFKLHGPSVVDLQILDSAGMVVATIIKQEKREYGKYVVPVDLKSLGLPAGSYYGKLIIDGQVKVMRVVVIKN
ncbi:MAG: T9SS type A sorting domain-containing protein [Saprospirales bacterium]|nr:T9SS type A sorting domain-containing protein [Saprospirales bacterium]